MLRSLIIVSISCVSSSGVVTFFGLDCVAVVVVGIGVIVVVFCVVDCDVVVFDLHPARKILVTMIMVSAIFLVCI